MCPAVGVSLQELAIGAASRSTVARFLIDARRRDGVMTQCVGRLGLKQLPMPVDVPTSRLLALSYRLVDGSQTIQACRSAARGFDKLNPNGHFKFEETGSVARPALQTSKLIASGAIHTSTGAQSGFIPAIWAPHCRSATPRTTRGRNCAAQGGRRSCYSGTGSAGSPCRG